VKDVATVNVGYVPRLGIAGRDHEDDIVAAIVVMGRTQHTNDVIPRDQAEVDAERRWKPAARGQDRSLLRPHRSLVGVTTHTVLHNLIFGCLLVFLVQWIFLGDLRSAIIVGVNIPFALFFSIIILVLQGQDANLLSIGAVDFGIIVDSAVILVENIYQELPVHAESADSCWRGFRKAIGDLSDDRCIRRQRCQIGRNGCASSSCQRFAGRQGGVCSPAAITVAAFVPLFTMQGVEGPDLRTDGADLRLRAGGRAALRHSR
jgi:cobalt-zinc-cadmium resistance protein CzcA